MWLLIPIDAYGISIAGATIKPYMIFAFVLPLVLYAKNKGTDFDLSASKGQLLAGAISVLILTQSVIIKDNMPAIKGSIMLIIVYVCAQIYTSCSDCKSSEQLSDVFIASGFGCSVVFIVSYILMQNGFNIDGLVAYDRAQEGIFMSMGNMLNGQYIQAYRLRGFAYDPNTMATQFIFCVTACTMRLFKKFNLYYLVTLIMSFICVFLSSSRMGILCLLFSIVATTFVLISRFNDVKKKISGALSITLVSASLLIFALTSKGQTFFSSLLSTYQNRSSLTDEYGRFSIWKECLNIYWNKNPLLGVGLGQMDSYTVTERMTHNTWLQFICECGLLVGGLTVAYFLTVMIIGWSKTRIQHKMSPDNTSYLCLVIGYTVTIISLMSVDNITCSYLWFGALLLLKMACYVPQEHNKVLNRKQF